jgi:hypothetical protein
MRSFEAYDDTIAGVLISAGGVPAGIPLGQEGVLDGDTNVAMTGRVYVQCTIGISAIRRGDRLTTASTPSQALKTTNSARSDGA